MSETEQPQKKSHGERLKRVGFHIGIWSGGLLVLAAVVLTFTILSMMGTRVAAPDWVRDRVIAQINRDMDGLRLEFDEMAILLQKDWVPQVDMQNVRLSDQAGTPLAQLTEAQSTLALRPLLTGDLRPGRVKLSGARLMIRRASDGAVDLQLGGAGPSEKVGSLADLVGRMDAVFEDPHFSALRRVSVEELSLQYDDARANKSWAVDGGHISLSRTESMLDIASDFTLLGDRGFATTLELGYRGEIGSTLSEFSITFGDMPAADIAGQSAGLSWLHLLDAPISGGLTVRLDEEGNLGPLAVTLNIEEGAVQPNADTRPIAFRNASAAFNYDPDGHAIRFQTLEVESDWISTRISGETRLEGMEDGWPDALVSQFEVLEMQANPLEIYETPLELEGAVLTMRHVLDPFEVRLGELTINDMGGVINVSGKVSADENGWHLAANAHVPEISPDRLLELWPETLKPKTRNWIIRNVKEVDLSDVQFALRAEEGEKPEVYLGFDFENLESQFVKGVPFVQEGRGTAHIQDNAFVIAAHSGYVTAAQGGRLDITGSSFEIPDINIKRGPGVVRLNVNGSITAGLSLLNSGPFGYLDKAGREVTLADGRASVEGRLDFNVVDDLKPEDVKIALTGTLSDVRSEKLIQGRVIAASELAVNATHERMRVGGKGRIGQVPFEGTFEMPFTKGSNGRAQVVGSLELSKRFMDEFRITLPPGSLSGATQGKIRMDFAKGKEAEFSLQSDLKGLGLKLDALNWALPQSATGNLTVVGRLSNPPQIDKVEISGAGMQASGAVELTQSGQLKQASFSRVRLGGWLDVAVDLVGRGPGQAPLIRVNSGQVDLRKASLGKSGGGGSGGGGPMSVQLDRLQISDAISMTAFKAELNSKGGLSGNFIGAVNGVAPVSGDLLAQGGRTGFIVRSQNAGSVLRAAQLLKQARDGRMELFLFPGQKTGVYEGKLKIKGLRVKDAPAIAAILNAVSLVGIVEQLGGEGIHFNEVDVNFQLAPDRVTVYSGSAVGASMGISVEGYYYPSNTWLDMEGVVSPIYAVNAVGSLFSARKGEGLVGFNYDVLGPAKKPRVKVNPLSLFTPGMFRDIFRRSPPERPRQLQAPAQSRPTTTPSQRQSSEPKDR